MSGPAGPMPRAEAARLLDVAEDADPADVQRAFLRAARRVHPDLLAQAGETERRAGAAAFVRLSHARDVLLVPAPDRPVVSPACAARPSDPAGGPVFHRVPGRGLGGSLVVLALLAFLLVALVTVEQAVGGRTPGVPVPAVSTP